MQVRCPHCRHRIELLTEQPLDDVTCPSCGSSFSLLGTDETRTHRAEVPAIPATIGHFTLTQHLGIGAFGSVWKAHDDELDVAIKVPRSSQLDQDDTNKFIREARAAAAASKHRERS